MAHSANGTTWSSGVPVAPSPATHDQFFPWLSIAANGDPWDDRFGGGFMGDYTGNTVAGSTLYASWMDMRNGSFSWAASRSTSASVVLAIDHQERGSEQLTPELLTTSPMSTVNLTEAHSKLFTSGWNADEAWLDATRPVGEIVTFTATKPKRPGARCPNESVWTFSWGSSLSCPCARIERSPIRCGPIVEETEARHSDS